MSKEQKIYVITAGEYSDYHVCAVTTDRERAEQLRKRYFRESYDGAEIEEFIDGDPEAGECKDLRPIWNAYLNAKKEWTIYTEKYINGDFTNRFELVDPKYITGLSSTIFRADVDAPDEEHALKIAQDKYAKLIAEEIGL